MTAVSEESPDSHWDGPDPHDWERNSLLVMAMEDVRAAEAMLGLLRGTRPSPPMSRAYAEALTILEIICAQSRETLALELLKAGRVDPPEEPADEATEAVGGIRGDGNGPGDRDHL